MTIFGPFGHSDAATTLPKGMTSCGLDLRAEFREGAPVDRFTITNRSTPDWSIRSITLNLEPSAGKLIFDTKDGGDGVEVFQPFREAGGNADLRSISKLRDGGPVLTLDFHTFEADQSYTFSIDVDDTVKVSELGQIRVAGSEITGASLSYILRGPGGMITKAAGDFDNSARSAVTGRVCQ
ncbi:MAG: aggregation factor core [Pseudomonadota bacterium]